MSARAGAAAWRSGFGDVRSRMQGLHPGLLPAALLPVTAVRILETLDLSAQMPPFAHITPLAHISEAKSADTFRGLFQALKVIGASAAAVVLMVLPPAPDVITGRPDPNRDSGDCGLYGTSVCVHQSAVPPDYLQLRAGASSQ